MLKAIFFDLDGTLLPMDEDNFTKYYFGLLCKKLSTYGYESKKLIDSIWAGTKSMYQNNGSITNREAFWNTLEEIYGPKIKDDEPIFDDFYNHEFLETKAACEDNPLAREIIDFCKENKLPIYLTTNPIFPRIGTVNRMSFVGLKEDDFKLITSYENSSYTKPNPNYFTKILEDNNLKPSEVILFGNNNYEDGECALKANIKCYLIEGHIISNEKALHNFKTIKMNEVISTIKKEMENN